MSLNSAPLWGRAVIERFSLFFVPSSTDIVESSVCMTSHPTPLFRTMFCPSVGPTTWSRQATTTILAWPCHTTHLPNPPPADDPEKGKCLAVEWVYLEAFFILPVIFCLFVFIICKRTGYLMRWRCNFIDYSFVWWNLDWTSHCSDIEILYHAVMISTLSKHCETMEIYFFKILFTDHNH